MPYLGGDNSLRQKSTQMFRLCFCPIKSQSKKLYHLSFKANVPPEGWFSGGITDYGSFTSCFITIQEAVMLGTRWGFIYLQKCSQGWTEANKVYPLLIWATGSLQLHVVGLEYQTSEFIRLFIDSCARVLRQKMSLSLLKTKPGWSPRVRWSRKLKQAGQKWTAALFPMEDYAFT